MLLKQLVTPLITQLLDRRSSVVKQACHLLTSYRKSYYVTLNHTQSCSSRSFLEHRNHHSRNC
ncbi:hypothetical protein PVAP13_1KG542698 [Panicum virgatum]|uniref:Uncharacterized protein n=1 Tax=Panicum virgatum TaxID=38727 RepID=A0A8T0XZV9_PANVG|nr:hypothetical protein PVAP13_1KG542698 [Panicum virgatum]